MLGKFKRKLSRTKSVADAVNAEDKLRALSLSPSDEALVTKLSFTPDTKIIERPPAKFNPSIATSRSERTVFNNGEAGFLSMPTELLLALKPYLRPSSEVALRHACSRFFYLYSMPSFYLSGDDRFDFVCMTERDQDPATLERLVCGHCRDVHPRSSFASTEIRRAPLDRDCRQVWLCAHRMLGYPKTIRLIKPGAEAPFRSEYLDPCSRCREIVRNRSVADRPEKGTSMIDLESEKGQAMLISKIAILQKPAPEYNVKGFGGSSSGLYKEVFGAKEVSDALQSINFRICPHIRLGDPYILSKFCRSCTSTQKLPPGVKGPPCISAWNKDDSGREFTKCQGACFDRRCRTKFMFQARESLQADASGRRQVWLFIVAYRWLGPLLSTGSDSNWRDHTVNHTERAEMRKDWERWNAANRPRQAMPNWSICLLHPEDSSLR